MAFGVNVVGKILKKGGEKTIQCDTCDSKKTTSLLEGARVLVYACVCVPMRESSCRDGRALVCARANRAFSYAWHRVRIVFDVAPLPLVTRWTT